MSADPNAERGLHMTLDDLFRRAGVHAPSRLALVDPPNRGSLIGHEPKSLTFAQADRAISAIAARLQALGLPANTIVGLQLPNTVESVIALLGVLRAGMVAAPLPLLWRRQDIVAALGHVGAKVIMTFGQGAEHVMQAAADLFPIRYVCGFGPDVPDGVVSLDDCFGSNMPVQFAPRAGAAADHVAVLTFDVGESGLAPVKRSHARLIEDGLALFMEASLKPTTTLMCALVPGSFASLSLGILPWLIAGGTLALHHPFDLEGFAMQARTLGACTAILPGPVVAPLADAGVIDPDTMEIIALWRNAERQTSAPAVAPTVTDVLIDGEGEPIAARRAPYGKPASLRYGMSMAQGFVCVGGYRFNRHALDAEIARADFDAAVLAVPHALLGERLGGSAAEPEALRAALEARGVNLLVSSAFRRSRQDAA